MKRIKIIVADPETRNVWADHLELSLAMLQAKVGCRSVELVAVGADVYMYVDGEGLLPAAGRAGQTPANLVPWRQATDRRPRGVRGTPG